MTAVRKGLEDTDLPGLFESADSASLDGQRQYLRTVRLRLLLAVLAACTGVVQWKLGPRQIDVAAIGTALTLVGVLLTELNLRTARPENRWYDGRALAESTKSLAWRFSVRGVPFALKADEQAVERRFLEQMGKLLAEAPTTSIRPSQRAVVSDRMRALRAADLATRKATYLEFRIADQQAWYARKAQTNERLARRWGLWLCLVELIGIAAAVAKASGFIQLDLAGVVAAMVAAGTAWVSLRQLATLARAYTFAANELTIAHRRLELVDDEATWAVEVADSEEAVSREHTMWRASRSRPSS